MNDYAITFDFHNTLAACPEWFELEVRRLPSAFLQQWSDGQEKSLSADVLDEADARYRQLRREIIEHGNELSAEACLEIVFAAMGLEIPPVDIKDGVEMLMRHALAGASPIPGAIETIRAIHRAGVPLGVVSSAVYHPFLEWTLASFGIRDAFHAVITSASVGFYKSRPEIYLHAAEALAAAPARMVHVGDSFRFDVAGANRAGLGAVWLRADGAEPTDAAIQPDLTLTTLEKAAPDILAVLRARLMRIDDERIRV
jgi:HAD superfamily hydrolase (TIGR01509 family)